LVPGETLESEVEAILLHTDSVSPDSIIGSDGGRKHYDRFFEFRISETTILGIIGIMDGHVADLRFIRYENNLSAGSLGINLGDVIDGTGEPDYLVRAGNWVPAEFIGEGFDTFVYLINSSIGYALIYDEDKLPEVERGYVREDVEIDEIIFFFPEDFDMLMEMGFLNLWITNENDFIDWNGFGEYPGVYP